MTPPRNGESTRACADCRTATATRSLRRVPMFTRRRRKTVSPQSRRNSTNLTYLKQT
jgi:hypothetical protein